MVPFYLQATRKTGRTKKMIGIIVAAIIVLGAISVLAYLEMAERLARFENAERGGK